MKNIRNLIEVASGRKCADAVWRGAKVLNVFTRAWEKKDIAVSGGYIASVAECGTYDADVVHDASDKFIVPGFIDAHVHIESSMVLPSEYARAVASRGTTAVIADYHEIANVLGPYATTFMDEQSRGAACSIYFMVPSCVPATDSEHTGGSLGVEDIDSAMSLDRVIGLGEMMNYPGVVGADDAVLKKIERSLSLKDGRAVLDGHAPLLSGKELQAYCACGISTDHECSMFKEVEEKTALGMYILIRQGSSARDLEEIIPSLVKSSLPRSRMCFCTDDKNIGDILTEGHIDSSIRNAISLGLSPVDAYLMASFNTAQCYGLRAVGAVAPGYKADFVVLDDEKSVSVSSVIKDGVCVSSASYAEERRSVPHEVLSTVHIESSSITEETFAPQNAAVFNSYAIELQRGSLNTKKRELSEGEGERGLSDSSLCRLTVIERHKGTGLHDSCLLKGYGLKKGAIAMSIGHDSHNIICAGAGVSDMSAAVKCVIDMQGGIAVCLDGKVLSSLQLNVGGLMSTASASSVASAHESLLEAARKLGIPQEVEPFVTLSFLALPVLPELRLTDAGLFDVLNWHFLR